MEIDPETQAVINDSPSNPMVWRRVPLFFSLLLFGFGMAAGFLLTFSGYGLEDSAAFIISIFLTIIVALLLLGAALLLFRRRILTGLFGRAEAQLELFADPLARVAEGAVARDPNAATGAARDLLHLAFARYAWVSTRRWMIASLTGLIAAMAALSGTALLFKQNQLIEVQSGLLAQQNVRIDQQTSLLEKQVELAEAQRNAELAVEITVIAGLLGEAMDRAHPRAQSGDWASLVSVLDPIMDINQSLRMRIISASRASQPYRFLEPVLRAYDTSDKMRVAAATRRADLPQFYEGSQGFFRWQEPDGALELIDRPASPERGQLLEIMTRSGLRDLESLNFHGLDLSFAWAVDMDMLGLSMQGAQLSYGHFSRTQILNGEFGGASLENARFDGARIEQTRFSSFDAATAKGPYQSPEAYGPTFLTGASFDGAFLRDVQIEDLHAMATRFDGATLERVSFARARLGGSTFRGAVLIGVDFTGTQLQSVEFDGAFVLREDFLNETNAAAAPQTFRPERFELEPSDVDALMSVDSAFQALVAGSLPQIGDDTQVWRIRRVQPFEQ